jgi:hypothetical protein
VRKYQGQRWSADRIRPLEREIFEDVSVHRLVLGGFSQTFREASPKLALKTANAASPEDWRKSGDEWTRLREEVGLGEEPV